MNKVTLAILVGVALIALLYMARPATSTKKADASAKPKPVVVPSAASTPKDKAKPKFSPAGQSKAKAKGKAKASRKKKEKYVTFVDTDQESFAYINPHFYQLPTAESTNWIKPQFESFSAVNPRIDTAMSQIAAIRADHAEGFMVEPQKTSVPAWVSEVNRDEWTDGIVYPNIRTEKVISGYDPIAAVLAE